MLTARISVEEAQEAYKASNFSPVSGVYYTEREGKKCGCVVTAIIASLHPEYDFRAEGMDDNIADKMIGSKYGKPYLFGFMNGFDNELEHNAEHLMQKMEWEGEEIATRINQGREDGLKAREGIKPKEAYVY